MIGQLVDGKYQIVRLLGEGGMGAVYEAVHTGTNRRVAIKVILGAEASTNEEMVGRFQREARAAGSIDTQHIVQVLDTGTDRERGLPFMVMEFLAGEDVEQLVRRVGPLSPGVALRIIAQACMGLQKAHEAGVVHRDIKPANLYLAERDGGEIIVKVLDFGIAKIKRDHLGANEDQALTQTGSMLGSPLYMSPEQAKGLRSIDHRTDIWSLGAVMYETLTGRSPHHDKETLGQLILALCSGQPRPVQDHAPWTPPEVAAIVHGALTLDVDQRFQSAQAFLDAVLPLLPDGHHLDASMFAPLSEERRTFAAPRLTISVPGVELDPERVASFGGGTIASGLSRSAIIGPKSSHAPLALGAVALIGALGFGAFKMFESPPPPAEAPAAASAPPKADPAPPQPAPIPAAPVERTVKVAITPPDATVEVYEEPADVVDGHIEITGPLGSLHPVTLRLGSNEKKSEVVVTEAGAMPATLTLEPPRPAVVTRPAAVVRPKVAQEGTPAKPPPAKKPAGVTIDRDFE